MKSCARVCLLLVAALLALSAAEGVVVGDRSEAALPGGDLALSLPAGWQAVEPLPDGTVAAWRAQSGATISVAQRALPAELSVEDWLERQGRQLFALAPQAAPAAPERISAAGGSWQRLRYELRIGERRYRQCALLGVRQREPQRDGIVLVVSIPAEADEATRLAAEAVLHSLHVRARD